jgi:hypothetical protein
MGGEDGEAGAAPGCDRFYASTVERRLPGMPFHPGLADTAVDEIAAALGTAFG